MWISLERFSAVDPQEGFLIDCPGWFEIQGGILAHLTPSESHRYLRTCIFLIVETRDLLLTATAVRLQYSRPGFSVQTPPVQPQLQLAGQGGDLWDEGVSSRSFSISETSSHAVEVQDTN